MAVEAAAAAAAAQPFASPASSPPTGSATRELLLCPLQKRHLHTQPCPLPPSPSPCLPPPFPLPAPPLSPAPYACTTAAFAGEPQMLEGVGEALKRAAVGAGTAPTVCVFVCCEHSSAV